MFVLSSCDVSFPKETLEQDAVDFIKRETKTDTKVYKVGSTLYLDVCFDDFVSDDKNKIAEIYETLQQIVSNIVRVPLSSDAKIDFVIISAFDPKFQTLLRIFENIDDIKLYSHQMISREDYSERQLMELEGLTNIKEIVDNKYDISKEEFVGKLIVSQLNNSSRSNPLISKLMQFLDLRFSHVDQDTIYFTLKRNPENDEIIILLEQMLEKEVTRNIQKYKLFSIKSAILLDGEKNIIFTVPIKL
jgi:hypothetical protein